MNASTEFNGKAKIVVLKHVAFRLNKYLNK